MIAIAKIPGARHYGRHSIIAVRVPLNCRVRRHEQQDRIKTRFGRVTEKHFGMDAGVATSSADKALRHDCKLLIDGRRGGSFFQ